MKGDNGTFQWNGSLPADIGKCGTKWTLEEECFQMVVKIWTSVYGRCTFFPLRRTETGERERGREGGRQRERERDVSLNDAVGW